MESSLAEFFALRSVFQELGVRVRGFALPRQHSLVHYTSSIQLFSSPNGLCSSITESRHITVVKRPWRRSSRHNALLQILRTNARLSKMAAIRVEFGQRGMLHGNILSASKIAAAIEVEDLLGEPLPHAADTTRRSEEEESEWYDGPTVSSFFELARHPGMICLPI
jgi:hypothetical protein